MIKRLMLFLVIVSAAASAQQAPNPQQTLNQFNQNFFIPNHGQWNPEVKYLARIGGMNAWITNSGVVYDYYRIKKNYDESQTLKMDPQNRRDYENKNTTVEGDVVRMQLVNAESNITGLGNNQKEGYYNYFIGNDKSKWASNVPLYDNIELKGVYKNINVKYYYDNGQLRYDYKVQPGADISHIKFKFDGQQGMSVNANGELVLKTSIGEVTNGKIYAYQIDGVAQKEVTCKFEQRQDGTIGLKANSYDKMKELIIDPLVYATMIGGSLGIECGNSIVIDASGNAYITGVTTCPNYPTTSGAYQTAIGGIGYFDAFIIKLNSTGSDLVYSTFIGGNIDDRGQSIAIDASGNAYITGYTQSTNYPTTSGAYQTAIGGFGHFDAFVTKLNSTGSSLVYSTYIGGREDDYGRSIAIDASENAYITGNAYSSNYPATIGAYQTKLDGINSYFITKLNSSGSALVYSTFIGGTWDDQVASIAIDANGNAYITGWTKNSRYPTTSGAYQTIFGGLQKVFVTKLNSAGSALVYSTFIGGNDNFNYVKSIAIDAGGNAYIIGYTHSTLYPTTSGAYQTSWIDGYEVFVTKFNSTGSALVYSTYIGGEGDDYGQSIAVDTGGNAYITGNCSWDFPTTSGAYDTTVGSTFVTKLNSIGTGLDYSTFVDYSCFNGGNSIAIDARGNTYITGGTSSFNNFPTIIGPEQLDYGYLNIFIIKLKIPLTPNEVQQVSPFNNSLGNIQPVQLKWLISTGASSYRLQFSSDSTFATTLVDTAGLTDTTLTVSGLSNLTKYYWRVNAMNVGGTSHWSQVWNFKTLGNPTQVVHIYPTAGSTNIPVSVNLIWKKSQDQLNKAKIALSPLKLQSITKTGSSGIKEEATVSKYWLELMIDTTSNNYVVNDNTLTDTTRLVSGLAHLTNYWWRVRAMNETGWQTSSDWINFVTIIDTPGVAILLSPNSSSNIFDSVSSILFTWQSAPLASKYELQIGLDQNFSTIIADTTGITDTSCTYQSTNLPKTFNWRIRGSNEAGTGSWSNSMAVSLITGINGIKGGIPVVYQLMQNYPNPFNPSSKIGYALPFSSNVKISIYNLLGEMIKELVNEQKNAGYYEVNFTTTGLASGVYFYLIEARSLDGKNGFRDVKKMVLLK